RPDPWGVRAWLVAGSGVAVAALLVLLADEPALHPGVVPLVAPVLPLWPALAVLVGLVPAFAAPPAPPLTRTAPEPAP
ncbi:energy-coupling factor transporter transmembrane protein EcfT, partial [Streptomyces sp. NEAU-H3]|nr:energy-coupling factor transporter transmembrane protein EcfT [Streptomyces sp. NEAU-H3]